MKTHVYGAVLHESEDGGYWVEVPDLPGCFSQGSTFMEAVASISNGLATHLAALASQGFAIPEAKQAAPAEGQVVYVSATVDDAILSEPSVSAAEAARMLGVTPGRVSQLIASGRLVAKRSASGTRVSVASIDEYARNRHPSGRPRKALALRA